MTAAPSRGVLWDTMFASRLFPDLPGVLETARVSRGTRLEVLLAAPVVSEVIFGLRRRAVTEPSWAAAADWWEEHVLAGPGRLRFVAPGAEAVALAAAIRARQPASPGRPRRADGRKDPERRVSWSRDIELAAIAATSGLPLATENLRGFTAIAELIRAVAPRLTLGLRESVFA